MSPLSHIFQLIFLRIPQRIRTPMGDIGVWTPFFIHFINAYKYLSLFILNRD